MWDNKHNSYKLVNYSNFGHEDSKNANGGYNSNQVRKGVCGGI